MKYRALITDVDGTLVPNKRDGRPSQKVIEAISKAKDVVHVGLATSRPFFLVKDIINMLDLSGPLIISGGTLIYDARSEEILWEKYIDGDTTMKAIDLLVPLKYQIFINDGEPEDKFYKKGDVFHKSHQVGVFDLTDKEADEVIDMLSVIPTLSLHKAPAWTPGKVGVVATHAEATKQHGIFQISKILGIKPEEMIGIGDGGNDLPLLLACGLGVAMGNAVPELKDIADYVAPSVDEDGLAHVIEKFILNPN